jgi:hypothetical protein
MKKLIWVLGSMLVFSACRENEAIQSEFTGNETVYNLFAGSQYNIDGTVTFKEKKDGKAVAVVTLSGTEGNIEHPVHIHKGDITAADADVYVLLNPVHGKTGKSETTISQSADEFALVYKDLINLEACIKVHLAASGPDRDIILAGGNIGTIAGRDISGGRLKFGTCRSE